MKRGLTEVDGARADDLKNDLDQRYELLGRLGQGGFALVYHARQRSTGQPVAIKVLRRNVHADPDVEREAMARFAREMALMAQFRHPRVVRLLDSGQVGDGQMFIAFEFIEGRTLAQVLDQEGALVVEEARSLLLQVLDALVAAHERGLVHRDIKPQNIMVSAAGAFRSATLLDFGVAKLVDGAREEGFESLTLSGTLLGTPSYLAPEQLAGHRPDARTDLFAWGLVFVEALTGQPVFANLRLHEILGRLSGPAPIPLPAWLADSPLGAILASVLDKDVSRRPASSRELYRAVERCALTGLSAERAEAPLLPSAEIAPTLDLGRLKAGPETTAARAERRQVTVLALSAEVVPLTGSEDPEAEAELLDRGLDLALSQVSALDGVRLTRSADGLVAVFGYPRAREDAAARAVRAALGALEQLALLSRESERSGLSVSARVGLHSGLVVASTDGDGSSFSLAGAAPQVAGRVAAATPPGAVWVTDAVRAIVSTAFATEPVGSRALGDRARGALFRVTGAREPEGDQAHRSGPLIGRDREIGLLTAAWERARSGAGSAMLLVGEPGIGKSRLLRELRRQLHAAGTPWYEATCAEDTRNSPLHPITALLSSALELGGRPPATALAHLERALSEVGLPLPENVPLLADLLGVPCDQAPPLPLSPQARREGTLEMLVSLVLGQAVRQPIAFVVEDLHWADPSTVELLARMLPYLEGAPVLVLLTARPGFRSGWDSGRLQQVRLERLEADGVRALARSLAQGQEVDAALLEQMVERAEGVPLFVEELTRAALEAPDAAPTSAIPGRTAAGRVPSRLRDALMARLDRLGQAREVAQVAAVIGREFTLDLLGEVTGLDEASLAEPVQRLVAAEVVFRRGLPSARRYWFKHSLLRDAAYESLLLRDRHRLHHKVADTLLREGAGGRAPEALAWHYAEAGAVPEALTWLHKAGEAALRRSANLEAEAYAQRGLDLVQGAGDPAAQAGQSVALYTVLLPALFASRGYAAPEVRHALDVARARAELLPGPHGFPIYWMLWASYTVQGRHLEALPMAERMLGNLPDPSLAMDVTLARGISYYYLLDLPRAIEDLRGAVAAYDPALHAPHAYVFGQDPGVTACAHLAASLWLAGYPDSALAAARQGLALAERVNHPFSTCYILGLSAVVHHFRQEPDAVLDLTARLLEIAERQVLPFWTAIGVILRGWAAAVTGQGGVEPIAAALAGYRAAGARSSLPYWIGLLGEAHLAAGDLAAADACFVEALAVVEEDAEPGYEVELLRLRARVAVASGQDPEAVLRAAVLRGEALGVPLLQLRAAVDLSRLLLEQGRGAGAHALVAPLRARFDEGADTLDIQQADALLARLDLRS